MLSMKKFFGFLKNLLTFLDKRTQKLLLVSSLLGLLWFVLELSFVYILQVFLLSMNLLSPDKLQIPHWLPVGIISSTILLISFGVVRAFVNFSKNYYSAVAQLSFVRATRQELINRGLNSKYFTSSSEFLTLFSDRVNQSGLFVQYLSLGLVSLSAVILFFSFGIYYAPKEMLFSLGTTILLMLPIKKITYRIQAFGESINSEWNEVNSNVILSKRNLFFLEVYDLVDSKKNEIGKNLLEYENNYTAYSKIASFLSSLPLLVGIFVLSICSYLSVEFFHTPGVRILSFFYIFLRMVQGLSELNSIYALLRLNHLAYFEVQTSLIKLRAIDDKSKKLENIKNVKFNFDGEVHLDLNSVAFAYSGEAYLYKNLSLQMKTGDILVVKGPSGAGKSTLLKLLLGLEKPSEGQVLLNQTEVQNLDPDWRMHLGYVGPDPFLIKGTIRENLHFGNLSTSNYTEHDYFEALELAGLSLELRQNNIGLDTFIAETSFLSTGQRQRLAIARAFLRKPTIVIFDEATANLDGNSEEQVIKNIQSFSNKILTIIVTHKNSFDKIGTKFINIGNA